MTKEQIARKAQGVCWQCGGLIDHSDRYVRCKTCRDQSTEYMRIRRGLKEALAEPAPNEEWAHRKARLEAEKALAAEKMRLRVEKCSDCGWVRREEGTLFCLFPEGVCMKGEYL